MTKIFVISMATAEDRRRTFAARAKKAGLEWQFFDACTGLVPGLVYDEAEAIFHKGRPLNPGELGCYASHFALWDRLVSGDDDQYIILEDDVIVDWSMLRKIAAVDFAASGVEYLRLYHKAPCSFILRNQSFLARRSALLELTSPAFGTQGYVVTRAAAETFLGYCRRVTRPVDDQLDRFWDHGVPNLCVFPFPLIEEAGASTIGDQRFADKSYPLKRRAAIKLDQLKRLLAVRKRRRTKRSWKAVPSSPG